jgi:cob(I)alamin adenosyltransferase
MLNPVTTPDMFDAAAEPAQHLTHDVDVKDVRDRRDGGAAFCQQRGSHQLQRGILGAVYGNLTSQAYATADQEPLHSRHCRGARRASAARRYPRKVGRVSVHLTRIYTKTGDNGTTALGDMSRVPKTDLRLSAYADVDETNSAIGVAIALGGLAQPIEALLTRIQNDLFDVGADLCTPVVAEPSYPPLRILDSDVERLEAACDEFNEQLTKLNSFILPGGTPGASLLHLARTIARRAERSTWALIERDPERTNLTPALYLNRLSDLLFILARAANPGGDVLWRPGGADRDSAEPAK